MWRSTLLFRIGMIVVVVHFALFAVSTIRMKVGFGSAGLST